MAPQERCLRAWVRKGNDATAYRVSRPAPPAIHQILWLQERRVSEGFEEATDCAIPHNSHLNLTDFRRKSCGHYDTFRASRPLSSLVDLLSMEAAHVDLNSEAAVDEFRGLQSAFPPRLATTGSGGARRD